ncbi:MAG: extracellular solute-binding protein [Cryobacterium sp.]|nr:extracellular solute-binding protein [Cryobacterium sp.]
MKSLGVGPSRRSSKRMSLWASAAMLMAGTLALSGCTPTSGGANGGNGGGDGDSKTVTVWHYFSDPNQVKVMTDYKDMFEKANDGVTVENVYVPYDQMNSKLISAVGAKTGPDVAVFNGAETATLALAGALAPLDEQWDGFADKGQFPDSVIHEIDGKTYSVQGYVNLLGLWYNADILDEVGVEPPTSMDELNDALDKVVAAGHKGITLSGLPQSQGEWQAYPWLTSAGFDYANADAASLQNAFSMIQSWTESGALTREAVTWDQTVPFQTFAAGGVAFAENGNWQQGTAKSDAKFNYGVVPLPVGDKGKVYLGGEGEAIGAFSKNPDLAWDYLESTYFGVDGELVALENVGSIPSRTDAASDDAVTSNDLLAAFAKSIEANGANYPAEVVPPESVADLQLTVGQAWSAVIGGQSTPADAASQVIAKLTPLLEK